MGRESAGLTVEAVVYWAVALTFVAFGMLAILSVGMPFLLLGLLLIGLRPVRDRRHVFWPPILGVVGLTLGYVLVAPLACSSQATAGVRSGAAGAGADEGRTTCTNLIGIDYSGGAGYNPPLWPALLAGLGAGAVASGGAWVLLRPTPGSTHTGTASSGPSESE